jgi:hypothetical protein
MRLFILGILLLLPLPAFAQTMWPVPQRDGTIVYVPIGTGTPPLWPSSDGRGGQTFIPNGVGSQPVQPYIPSYVPPPLTVPDFSSSTRNSIKEFSDARHEAFESVYGR